MSIIYVKMKDKSSQRCFFEQRVSVIGDVPQKVEKSTHVIACLKKGVIIEVNEKEYKSFHSDKKVIQNESISELHEVLAKYEAAIADGKLKEAEVLFKVLKELKADQKTMSKCKETLLKLTADSEIILSKKELEKEKAKLVDQAIKLVSDGISAKVIVEGKNKMLCLGEIVLGSTAEDAKDWVLAIDENKKMLIKAIEAAK